ncbi:MAG: bifunctional DNA-formamidopyrimidine glycosylase/DNA-(apurinic or apyrimidinic site) lyase [Acidimicrobiia bacterium]|nr:bifunctional DNA-formamidopyrimidine glycosylase/DNA-(apurinic or apyrimidinic site) lyase [Acidimicrobiia bacterium]
MPELPEVETTRLCLIPLEGRSIVSVDVQRDRMLRRQPRPSDFGDRLAGRRLERWDRHGKFLLAHLDGDITWVTHLGMSGRVSHVPRDEARVAHSNVVVGFDDETEFRLVDPRTFGFVAAYLPQELEELVTGHLGPDALNGLPRSPGLVALLGGRTAPIKALLLDQTVLAGVGNIYADEALHRARVSPLRPGGELNRDEVKALRAGIRRSLEAGLKWGGTSLDDLAYLLPDGRAGEFAGRLRVYGREDEPCPRCGGTIRRDVVRQRSSFWCPKCQS